MCVKGLEQYSFNNNNNEYIVTVVSTDIQIYVGICIEKKSIRKDNKLLTGISAGDSLFSSCSFVLFEFVQTSI